MVTRFAPIRFYRQTTLRTEAFAQSSFYAQIFLHRGLCTKKIFCTQAPLEAFTHKKHVHKMFYRQTVFTQKVLRTEVLRTEFFYYAQHLWIFFYIQMLLHTDVFTQTQIAHRKLCTQHAFTHSQLLHREALLPLLVHLPFVFPLSSLSSFLSLTLPTSAASSAHVVESLASKLPSINRF